MASHSQRTPPVKVSRGFRPGDPRLHKLWEELSQDNPPPRGLRTHKTLDTITIEQVKTRDTTQTIELPVFLVSVGTFIVGLALLWFAQPLGPVVIGLAAGLFLFRQLWQNRTPLIRIQLTVEQATIRHHRSTKQMAYFESDSPGSLPIISQWDLQQLRLTWIETAWIWGQIEQARAAAIRKAESSHDGDKSRRALQNMVTSRGLGHTSKS